jgi:hypothetical protein
MASPLKPNLPDIVMLDISSPFIEYPTARADSPDAEHSDRMYNNTTHPNGMKPYLFPSLSPENCESVPLEHRIQALISFTNTTMNRLESLERSIRRMQMEQVDILNLQRELEKQQKDSYYRTLWVIG